jgi:hypothetical protein
MIVLEAFRMRGKVLEMLLPILVKLQLVIRSRTLV